MYEFFLIGRLYCLFYSSGLSFNKVTFFVFFSLLQFPGARFVVLLVSL